MTVPISARLASYEGIKSARNFLDEKIQELKLPNKSELPPRWKAFLGYFASRQSEFGHARQQWLEYNAKLRERREILTNVRKVLNVEYGSRFDTVADVLGPDSKKRVIRVLARNAAQQLNADDFAEGLKGISVMVDLYQTKAREYRDKIHGQRMKNMPLEPKDMRKYAYAAINDEMDGDLLHKKELAMGSDGARELKPAIRAHLIHSFEERLNLLEREAGGNRLSAAQVDQSLHQLLVERGLRSADHSEDQVKPALA